MAEKESTEYLIRKAVIAESTAVYQELREILDHDHEMMPYVNGFQFIDQGNTTGKAALSKILDEVGATNGSSSIALSIYARDIY